MLAAAIGLYMAYGDGEAGPEVAFAAYDQEQAKICYGAARFMIEANDDLYEQTVIYNSALEMKLRDNPGGILRCLSRAPRSSSARISTAQFWMRSSPGRTGACGRR